MDSILELNDSTKVILITPPPINISTPRVELDEGPMMAKWMRDHATNIGFQTYMSKRIYAQKVMEIANSYEKKTDRVAGCDFWTQIIDWGKAKYGSSEESDDASNMKLPGSGVIGAKEFGKDVFVDGLHLGPTVSRGGVYREVVFSCNEADVRSGLPSADRSAD